MGRKAVAINLDVLKAAGFDQFKAEVIKVLRDKWNADQIHFLVNNAGTGAHAMIADTSEETFDSMVNIHFKSAYFLTQKFLPLIADNGRIVNLSTGLERFAFPGYAA